MQPERSSHSIGSRIKWRLNMHETAGLICIALAIAVGFVFPLVAMGFAVCGITSSGIGAIKRTIPRKSKTDFAPGSSND